MTNTAQSSVAPASQSELDRVPARAVRAEGAVTLRFGSPDDPTALARLAELDSAGAPRQPVLLAEVGGELRAALSLSTGEVVADPFRRTDWLVDLLRARARQLHAADTITSSSRQRLGRLRSLLAWR